MIVVVDSGTYTLAETKHGTKLLRLDDSTYAWIVAPRIGSLLIRSSLPHIEKDVLSRGAYRIYSVTDEPHFSDQLHLEVEVGYDTWQGYLLPTGLPDARDTRKLLIPTHEVITHNPAYRSEKVITDGQRTFA